MDEIEEPKDDELVKASPLLDDDDGDLLDDDMPLPKKKSGHSLDDDMVGDDDDGTVSLDALADDEEDLLPEDSFDDADTW